MCTNMVCILRLSIVVAPYKSVLQKCEPGLEHLRLFIRAQEHSVFGLRDAHRLILRAHRKLSTRCACATVFFPSAFTRATRDGDAS